MGRFLKAALLLVGCIHAQAGRSNNAPRKPKLPLSINRGRASSKPSAPVVVEQSTRESFLIGLLSGAVAGTTVDLVLYPLDTVKTRLQAKAGPAVTLDLFKGQQLALFPNRGV